MQVENDEEKAPEKISGTVEDLAPQLKGDIQDTDDGGAIVDMDDKKDVQEVESFYANLAKKRDTSQLAELGQTLHEYVEEDRDARKKRDQDYETAIKKSGLGGDSGSPAAFAGANKTVHPMLAKGCIDFGARTVKELLPSSNIVKDFIPGKVTRERLAKSKRKVAHMNWQLKKQMPEFRTEMEQLFTQLPLGGSQYLSLTYDAQKKRPVPRFWSIEDVLIPESATNFYTAERMTLIERITQQEYERRFEVGLYFGEPDVAPATKPELKGATEANEAIEGKGGGTVNIDGLREINRIRIQADLEDEGVRPYIVEMNWEDSRILSIIRNWEQEDETFAQMDWVIDFTFLYWKGAVGIGLYHLIGSLSVSATGAIRALLDSAHINNLPTLVKLKGGNMSGQTLSLSAGEVNELEGSVTTDDIRKLLMAVPFNPPSVVLLQLLGMITQFGEDMVRTTFDGFADGRQDVPVGTMMAMIEQGMKVLGSIHLRLYASMTQVLSVLARINRMYLDSEDVKDETGEVLANRDDYEGPEDVIPCADPETFSDIQRMTQIQMISQRAMLLPQLYDLRKVEELILDRSRIPNATDLLVPAPEPRIMNPVNENAAMALGQPVTAHPEQDHLAHLQTLLDFGLSPNYGMNPLIAPAYLSAALNHIKEHMIYHYVERMSTTASDLVGSDITEIMKHEDNETRAEVDKTLAAISGHIVPEAQQTFAKMMPAIQQLMQAAQEMTPQMPMDPKLGAAQIQAQSKAEDRASKEKLDSAKLQLEGQALQQGSQLRGAELQQRATEAQGYEGTEQQKLAASLQQAREKLMDQERARQHALNLEYERGRSAERAQAADLEATMALQTQAEQADLARSQMELQAKEMMNDQNNEVALTIAQAEIESGEKVSVENGRNVGPGK